MSKPPCSQARARSNFICAATAPTIEEAQAAVDELAGELEDELDDAVFSTGGESLEEIVGYFLQMRDLKLAVAESCTGGMVAERITSVPGSSRFFLGGAVVYSNELKTLFADVPPLLIEAHGAVSKEVAVALAENIREICNADIGLGITGIAGPDGRHRRKACRHWFGSPSPMARSTRSCSAAFPETANASAAGPASRRSTSSAAW